MTHFTTPTKQVARKDHECICCIRTIGPGETYSRGRGYNGDEAWTWKSCAHCDAVIDLYGPEDMDGMWSHDGHNEWADYPRDVTELRHAVGWRMQWRTRTGKLLPIPTRSDADPVTVILFLVGALKFGFGVILGVGLVAAAIITPIKYWRKKET